MTTMIANNALPSIAQANSALTSKGGVTKNNTGDSFGTILNKSVKTSQTADSRPQGAAASAGDTSLPSAHKPAADQPSDLAAVQKAAAESGADQASTVGEKTTAAAATDPYTMLLALLQAVTMAGTQQQANGQSTDKALTDAQAALQQLLAQKNLSTDPIHSLAADLQLLAKQGNLTDEQLTQTITQLTKSLQAQATASTAATNSAPVNTAVAAKTDSAAAKAAVNPAGLFNHSGRLAPTAASLSSADNSILPSGSTQTANPFVAVLQAEFTGKLPGSAPGSTTGNKTAGKYSAADKNSSPLEITGEAVQETDARAVKITSEGQQALQFDGSQLFQSSGDTVSNSSADLSAGTFAQMLGAEQVNSSAAATPAETAAQTNSAAKDAFQVVQQIVDQAKLITRVQNTEMVIRLKPEHLGELTLKITVEAGLVNATFHSNNSDVRSAIEASLPQLKQDLVNSGLKVDNVGVYTSLDQSASQQHNSSQPQPQLTPSRRATAESFDDAAQLVEEAQRTSDDGVDYRI